VRKVTAPLVVLIVAAAARPSLAQDDAFEFFREEAKVYTASRRPEPAWRAPVAVDVVTAEEIGAYGYENLWDVLRFRAGMDVLDGRSGDGGRAIVSARGFSRDFVSEMQVLVDGRSVYSPFLGGVYWANLPVQMQDVERIEIVRGPNAALYGSNAALGVINIITRRPGNERSAALSARGGNRSAAVSEAAEAGVKRGGLRLSHTLERAAGHPRPDGTADATDFLHSNKLNLSGRVAPDDATDLELMAGGSFNSQGVPTTPSQRLTHEQNFEMIRAERRLASAGTIEAVVSHYESRQAADPSFVGKVEVRTYQYDAEVMHRTQWADRRVSSVLGAGWRMSGVHSEQAFASAPSQRNQVLRGFTHHAVKVHETLTATAGVSLEDSRAGGFQPAWQAAAVYAPREGDAFRLSYSRAPTMPPLFNKYADYRASAATRVLGNPDLAPQQLSSWEAGWGHRAMNGALRTELTVYYLEIKDRIFTFTRTAGAPALVSYDNRNRASARGVEASVEHAFAAGRAVFANYTFEVIRDDKGPSAFDATGVRRGTPEHKANVGGRTLLGRGFGASALLGYKDSFASGSLPIKRSFRLDARLSWTRADWDLFVAGRDLLQPYRVETNGGTAVPRRFEAGVSKRFAL